MEVLLIKICKIQPLDLLFIVVFISFYISRYHFSQIFKTSFSIIWKKDFCFKFSFFRGDIHTQSVMPNIKLMFVGGWVGFDYSCFNVAVWRCITFPSNRKFLLWRLSGTKNSLHHHHSSLLTYLLSFYITLKNVQASIEIKNTFNTKRSRELKIGDVEIGDHSKPWYNISDLLNMEIQHLLYSDAFNTYAFVLQIILKCV